mgnify:FL=1
MSGDGKHTDRDGARKNLQIIRDELSDAWHVWRTTHADQPGWTHEVMQKARDAVRHAPVTCATLLVFGLVALVVAIVI